MDTRLAQNAEEFNLGQSIKIDSNIGIIEESAGRRRFCLDLNGMLHDYEKRMLCESRCPYTLPMHFITIAGKESAYYDFTGFLQLEEYIKRNLHSGIQERNNHKPVGSALELLAQILNSMKGMENYLLFPERFSIQPDTIFIHYDGHVSFACYTIENPESPLQERIIALIETLVRLYQDHDAEQYLIKYKEMILMKNPGLDGMISILGTLKREVGYIYWNTKNFRKEEKNSNPVNEGIDRSQNTKDRTGLKLPLKKDARSIKFIAVQAVSAAGLAAVFLFGALELTSFIGLAALTAGADLWLMRKIHSLCQGNKKQSD